MTNYKLGFIGSGKMAGAIIKGLLDTNFVNSNDIIATQLEPEGLEEKSKDLGVKIVLDNKFLAKNSEIIILAVKPSQVVSVLEEIADLVKEKLVVSIAAGITAQKIESKLSEKTRVIRVMPNTPMLISEGMSAIVAGSRVLAGDIEFVQGIFAFLGKCLILDNESQMDIVTAISGSGPAFYYKVINDIARAGEKLGLDYEKSLLLSIQTAIGSAKMALNREISMENLISNVATKGGCTRVGIDTMEEFDTAKIFTDVISKTTKKASELGK